jgi:hypothetical protein
MAWPRSGTRRARSLGLLPALGVAVLFVTACQALLPSGKSEIQTEWASFDEAMLAMERIVPWQSTRQDVHAAGLEPGTDPTITILSFSDVMQRFTATVPLNPDHLEAGIRDCLLAGKRCTGYAINVKRVKRKRIGNFWLDSFNFRRETETTGWSFNALVVFVDDLVVYELTGGQPRIHELELSRNPLGPLQSWGDMVLRSVQ